MSFLRRIKSSFLNVAVYTDTQKVNRYLVRSLIELSKAGLSNEMEDFVFIKMVSEMRHINEDELKEIFNADRSEFSFPSSASLSDRIEIVEFCLKMASLPGASMESKIGACKKVAFELNLRPEAFDPIIKSLS